VANVGLDIDAPREAEELQRAFQLDKQQALDRQRQLYQKHINDLRCGRTFRTHECH
jgi:hypothetical protein